MRVGVKLDFYLGQKVRLKRDGRTGELTDLTMRGSEGIQATVYLDEPYRHPEMKLGEETFRAYTINCQTVHILEIEPVIEVDDQRR